MLKDDDILELQDRWLLISPYHVLGHLQQQIFGLIPVDRFQMGPWVVCVGTTVLGFIVAHGAFLECSRSNDAA